LFKGGDENDKRDLVPTVALVRRSAAIRLITRPAVAGVAQSVFHLENTANLSSPPYEEIPGDGAVAPATS
jgi:hypothetical protein